eukprot:s3685_g8.t1
MRPRPWWGLNQFRRQPRLQVPFPTVAGVGSGGPAGPLDPKATLPRKAGLRSTGALTGVGGGGPLGRTPASAELSELGGEGGDEDDDGGGAALALARPLVLRDLAAPLGAMSKRRTGNLFATSHEGIIGGARWAGVDTLSKMCTIHQMREVSYNFGLFRPLIQEHLSLQIALNLAPEIAERSGPLFGAMVAAVSLYVNDPGECDPLASMTEESWSILLLSMGNAITLTQFAVAYFMQIANQVYVQGSTVGLIVELATVSATMNNLIQGNKAENVRVLQHRDRQRREVLKDLRAAASAKSQSASPCKWSSKWRGRSNRASSSHPTEGESSSDIPASPSNARRGKPTPEAEDEDVESLPSHPSQIESDEDDVPDTDPATYTLKDVKDEELDMSDCVQKVLEGLRGDAFCIASDIGEPMLSYIARRKRWWSTLRELVPDIRLSEAMRANLLVELSGLDRTEQLMIKTAARTHSVDEYAKDGEHPNGEERPEDGYGYEGYPATAPGGEPDDEWIDDEDLAVQLNAYTAVAFEAELDDLDDTYAESVRSYAQTAFVQATGKTKGKGKPGGKPGGTVVRSLQQPHHSGQKGQASRIEGDGPMSEMWHHWPLGR